MTTDGRIARRERNQGTVLDAVVELFESGNPDPAVEDVSERSGVSTRSIYRYFHHRDGLMDAALWHLVERVTRDVPLNVGEGTLDERISEFVEHRLDVYDSIAPLTRAARRTVGCVEVSDAADPVADVADRPVFVDAAATCFAGEFSQLPSEVRPLAEVATEMALQFETLEFLMRAFDGDRSLVAAALVRHLSQQLSGDALATVPASNGSVAPKSVSIL